MLTKIQNEGEANIIAQAIRDGKLTGKRREAAIQDLRKFDEYKGEIGILNQIDAAGKGLNVGLLAKVGGAPVDIANALIKGVDAGLEFIGVPEDLFEASEEPFGGEKSIRRGLTAGGMGYMDIKDLPEEQRPIARGAETVGEVTGMAAPVFGAASRMSPAKAMMQAPPSNMVREMVKSTARNPGKMAAIEGTSALGAGVARAGAEAVAPGNEFIGMPAEIIGGLAGPAPMLRAITNKTKSIAENFTPRGREEAASRKVREILEENQYLTKNPEADESKMTDLVEQLKKGEGSGLTSAQVVQDPKAREVLTAIENKLISDAGDELKTAINTQNKKSIDKFNRQIKKLNNSTNPIVAKEAQELRIEFLNKNLDKTIKLAEDKAVAAVAKVLTKNKDDAINASASARQIIDDELKLARNTETKLWAEVDKSIPSPTKQTIRAFNSIKDEISPNEQVMKPLENFINGLIKRKQETLTQNPGRGFMSTAQQQGLKPVVRVSAKELFRKRSVALNLARQAKATGRFNDARMLNKLADGMLKDLDQVTDVAANVAREFSRSLNEKFNTKLIRNAREAEPGVFLEKAGNTTGRLQGSDAQRSFNFQALKKATERTVDTMETARTTETLNKSLRDFVESAAAEVIDPFTNQVKPEALSKFINNNQLTLREVGMLDDITDVDKKVKLATKLQQTAIKGKAFVEKKSIAAQIARGKDDLSEVIAKAFDSNYQADAFKDLAVTVKRSKNPDAIEGLRHGVFDELIKRATINKGDLGGLISGNNLDQLLNNKIGKKTLRQNLMEAQLITPAQSANLTKISEKAKVFENVVTDPRKLNTLISSGDGVINLLARIMGSRLGAMTAAGQGAPLVMAQAGSRTMQKILEKVPALKVQGVLTQAIQDPKFMADLLQKRAKPQKQLDTRINAYLLQAGLLQD